MTKIFLEVEDSSKKLSVAVAIPTYNREKILVETVKQVIVQSPPADEILIVDQTEKHQPSTEKFLSDCHKRGVIRWIKQFSPNLNAARNRALWETKCDVLIFIDDDVTLSPAFIYHHVRNYQDDMVVAVAGRTIQAKGNIPAHKATPWVRFFGFKPYALDGKERLESVANFIGANHSVRVDFARSLGGYDKNYIAPMYDESDFALKICKARGRIVFDPDAELFHLMTSDGGTRSKRKPPEYHMSLSAIYFYTKHYFPSWYFWKHILFILYRKKVLYKKNLMRPWRIPWATLSYLYSIYLTIKFMLFTNK